MAVIELDFHQPDDTYIGTLDDSQLIECELRPALQELGAISFTLSRHLAAASAAMLAKGNLIKVRIPEVDVDPIALFVLKDDVSQLVHRDEQGGEHLTVTGPGGLHMLSYARLRYEFYAPEQPTRGDWDDEVSWNWRGRPYGGILTRIIEEGIHQPGSPLAAITLDFDRTQDSNGQPWAIIAEDFSVPIGIDVLTVANRLATAGDLIMVMTPDLVLHAYQTFGRDLAGAFAADNVRFEKGINVLTELERKTRQSRVTHLITRDMDQTYRTYVTPDAYDQAVYGFADIDWTNDPDQIEKTALNMMDVSDEGSEAFVFESLPGLTPVEGEYLPGPAGTNGHFWIGDEVTIHTGIGGHNLNAQSVTLSAVSIVLDIAADDSTAARAVRSLRIVPEVTFGKPLPAFTEQSAANASPGCVCLKFCQPSVSVPPTLVGTGSNAENAGGPPGMTVPPGLTNAVMFIAVPKWLGQTFPPAAVSWNGQAATLYNTLVHPTQGGVALYYILNPSPGSAHLDTSNSDGLVLGAWLYEGVNQSAPIAAWSTATGASAAPAASLASIAGAAPFAMMTVDDDDFVNDTVAAPVPGVGSNDWGGFVQLGFPGFRDIEIAGSHGHWSASWTLDQSHPWSAFVVAVAGVVTGGDGAPADTVLQGFETHGTARCVSHGDHQHAHGLLSTDGLDYHDFGGVTDHGVLTGLGDDDHPQYATDADLAAHAADGGLHSGGGGGGAAADPIALMFGAPDSGFEFDTTSLAGLTAMGAATVVNADTTIPGHLYLRRAAVAGVNVTGRHAAIPGSYPWTAITKVTFCNFIGVNFMRAAGLYLTVASPGAVEGFHLLFNGGWFWSTVAYSSPTAFTATITSLGANPVFQPMYFAIRGNSATSFDYMFSINGYNWHRLNAARNPGFTVANIGMLVDPENATVDGVAAYDFLRFWHSSKTFLGV